MKRILGCALAIAMATHGDVAAMSADGNEVGLSTPLLIGNRALTATQLVDTASDGQRYVAWRILGAMPDQIQDAMDTANSAAYMLMRNLFPHAEWTTTGMPHTLASETFGASCSTAEALFHAFMSSATPT